MEPIPAPVVETLQANIDSVDQLEILRLVVGEPHVEHPASALAAALHINLEVVEAGIAHLSARGLLDSAKNPSLVCRHLAEGDPRRARVEALVGAYVQRPVTIIKMVYEKPPSQIQSFSDAFRFKKES